MEPCAGCLAPVVDGKECSECGDALCKNCRCCDEGIVFCHGCFAECQREFEED